MIQLSVYISGRRLLCMPVPPALMLVTLGAIAERMPELEAKGRVSVTAEEDRVIYIIPMQQELS